MSLANLAPQHDIEAGQFGGGKVSFVSHYLSTYLSDSNSPEEGKEK